MPSEQRAIEVVEYAEREGDAAAEAKFDISHETLRRYRRMHRQMNDESQNLDIDTPTENILRDIVERYSKDELKAIAKGGLSSRRQADKRVVEVGDSFSFGLLTDTHIGHKNYHPEWMTAAAETFRKHDVDFIIHAGDVTEGMSGRDGHIYELTDVGYTAQKKAAIEEMRKLDALGVPIYAISGNHDLWQAKTAGAWVVPDIMDALDNGIFLGDHEGDIHTDSGVHIKLWHGEDSAQKAHSSRIQGLIDMISRKTDVSILVTGHDHKSHYFYERGVHAITGGTLQAQTNFMRRKGLIAMPSYWVARADVAKERVVAFTTTLFPLY